MKILIAASEHRQQLLVSLLAPPPPHTLRLYSDAHDAILSLCRAGERNAPYQVVVLDTELADWLEVAGFVRDLNRDMNWRSELIFISPSDDLALRIDAANHGAAAFLLWPERAREIPQLIKALER